MRREDARKGQRVWIHPDSGWYGRGATHGRITSKRRGQALVQLEGVSLTDSRLRCRIPYEQLEDATEEGRS